jgi:hypothetical protein
MSVILH